MIVNNNHAQQAKWIIILSLWSAYFTTTCDWPICFIWATSFLLFYGHGVGMHWNIHVNRGMSPNQHCKNSWIKTDFFWIFFEFFDFFDLSRVFSSFFFLKRTFFVVSTFFLFHIETSNLLQKNFCQFLDCFLYFPDVFFKKRKIFFWGRNFYFFAWFSYSNVGSFPLINFIGVPKINFFYKFSYLKTQYSKKLIKS